MFFLEFYGNPVIPCWLKDQRIFVSSQTKLLHSHYNTLRRLTYYNQSYCKYTQIYALKNLGVAELKIIL